MQHDNCIADYSTRQWLSLILQKVGMPRRSKLILQASDKQVQFYIDLVKILGQNDNELKAIMEFANM